MIYVIGVDIGSAFSKAVVMAGGKIVSYHVMPSGGNYKLTAEAVAKKALAKAKLSFKDADCIVATGYGTRMLVLLMRWLATCPARGEGCPTCSPRRGR